MAMAATSGRSAPRRRTRVSPMRQPPIGNPPPSDNVGWHLEHSYAQLPEIFHERWAPVPVPKPRMVVFNRPLAESLGLDAEVLAREESAAVFTGNQLPDGARPLAQAYAGHQY